MIKKFLKKFPGATFYARFKIVNRYFSGNIRLALIWIFSKREDSNFYYKITELNREQLLQSISFCFNQDYETIEFFFQELENDNVLRNHLRESLEEMTNLSLPTVDFGRRIVWYAITRIMKPKLVIESGVAHGVGSCIIAKALELNALENFEGRYLGIDIDPLAGAVFTGKYASFGKIIHGDALTALEAIDTEIDLFISDSDHRNDYECREYFSISNKLSKNAVILSDNSHVTSELSNFSKSHDRNFIFLPEKPEGHWYPGAGVGISISKS